MRGSVITLISGRSGVGTTHLALNVGVCLARAGYRTILVDAAHPISPTPMGTSSQESIMAGPHELRVLCAPVASAAATELENQGEALRSTLDSLAQSCDLLLVDCDP